jgi:hypothetical protein
LLLILSVMQELIAVGIVDGAEDDQAVGYANTPHQARHG